VVADAAKVDAIRTHFKPLVGTRLVRYQTAELLHEDGTWQSWPDLPIRIVTDNSSLISISWSCFDDLTLTNDDANPPWVDSATTRWIDNSIEAVNGCLGQMIRGVLLGRGQMSIGDREMEIWTRLIIELEDCWLEVFNALDENGYQLHHTLPNGEMCRCL